jgi:hypothetical protein
MARVPNDSDRDFPPDPNTRDTEDPAWITAHIEALETFDDTIRARFGRVISSIVTKQKRRQ